MSQDQFVTPNVTPETEKTETVAEVGTRKPWRDPVVTELEISRTSNNPSTGSDGGTGDCQHL